MKYQKKPIVIEAEQYLKGKPLPFAGNGDPIKYHHACGLNQGCSVCGKLYIETLEGKMIVAEGDWIIRGVKGEFYPCKPEVFEASYTKVEGHVPALSPHQQRVVLEKAELDLSLRKLTEFFKTATFAGLSEGEMLRLRRQSTHMSAYSDILAERIAAF